MDCYRCGQEGHPRNECPERWPVPAAPRPSAGAEPTPTYQPPPFASLYQRPADQIADPAPWADLLREAMGWSRHHREDRLRELAAKQAAESRLAWRL